MTSQLDNWMASRWRMAPEQLNRQVIENRQLQLLNRQLAWCRSHSSFYADYPAGLDSLDQLAELPFLTAQQLAEQGGRLLCISQSDVARVVTMETSGTTGQPKRLYFSQGDQQLTVDFFACGLSELHRPGDRCLVLMPGNHPGGMSHLIQQALRQLEVVPVPCGNGETFAQMAALVQQHGITTAVGSPVQLASLGRYMKHRGMAHSLRAVLVSSDTLPDAVRTILEQELGLAVYDHYGITEAGLGFAIECQQHHGLHIREHDLLVEIIDPTTGLSLPDGQWGELVFTTLNREAMPLLRYRTGDRARLLAEPCPCGSVVKRLDRVTGRMVQLAQRYAMARLDEAVFSIAQVVDYTAAYRQETGTLTLQLLLTAPAEGLWQRLMPLLQPGDSLALETDMVTEQSTSLHRGKRRVQML